jgi:hypothetical protein
MGRVLCDMLLNVPFVFQVTVLELGLNVLAIFSNQLFASILQCVSASNEGSEDKYEKFQKDLRFFKEVQWRNEDRRSDLEQLRAVLHCIALKFGNDTATLAAVELLSRAPMFCILFPLSGDLLTVPVPVARSFLSFPSSFTCPNSSDRRRPRAPPS